MMSLEKQIAMIFALLFSVGQVPVMAEEEIKQEWQPTTLSEATLEKVQAGVADYQKCLNDETRQHMKDPDDSRRVADLILGKCEARLTVVRKAFDAEQVPPVISDRYVRSKRSRGAQQVMKIVMAQEAARASESASHSPH